MTHLSTATAPADPHTPGREAPFLALLAASNRCQDGFERLLLQHGLTLPQYNVLRILRGGGAQGLCRHEVGSRLLSRGPDVTRLLDRMEAMRLVVRERSAEDRRLVAAKLTSTGRAKVDALDPLIAAEHRRQQQYLSDGELDLLTSLLERFGASG